MKTLLTLIILGAIALSGQIGAVAATPGSDWPSLDAGPGSSNFNAGEHTLTAKNVLHLKVRWSQRLADASYPVVANGRVYLPFTAGNKIHVRVVDAATGKGLAVYTKDAVGGILVTGGNVYLAGHVLQAVDATTGQKVAQIAGSPRGKGSDFIFPQADARVVLAGWASGAHSSLYLVDPSDNQVLQKLPSSSAFGTLAGGHILTANGAGSTVYDEGSGHAVQHSSYLGSYWFAGDVLAYTVAPHNRTSTALDAFDASGRRIWGHTVGPALATRGTDWPHAVGPNTIYVQNFRPRESVLALDELSGHVLWSRPMANIQRLALANNLVFALTYGLGAPVRLVVMRADTGKILGAIVLSTGYYAFSAYNGLMVADGMVFIRAIGPTGPQIVALGLPSSTGG